MSNNSNQIRADLVPDCQNCFGLCCVALPFEASSDFACNKDGGRPCQHLQSEYRCGIHSELRNKGYRGCTVFECLGAGQKVSQQTFKGMDWRDNPNIANQMFLALPIMQQLHEMLLYLSEILSYDKTSSLHKDVQVLINKTEELTSLEIESLLTVNIPLHRVLVNEILIKASELIRYEAMRNGSKNKKNSQLSKRGADLIGAKLKRANLRGVSFRGAYLIASDLREANLREVDWIGADLRDVDLSGADLTGSFFLTQMQINAANGDISTKLPDRLKIPTHWRK